MTRQGRGCGLFIRSCRCGCPEGDSEPRQGNDRQVRAGQVVGHDLPREDPSFMTRVGRLVSWASIMVWTRCTSCRRPCQRRQACPTGQKDRAFHSMHKRREECTSKRGRIAAGWVLRYPLSCFMKRFLEYLPSWPLAPMAARISAAFMATSRSVSGS